MSHLYERSVLTVKHAQPVKFAMAIIVRAANQPVFFGKMAAKETKETKEN